MEQIQDRIFKQPAVLGITSMSASALRCAVLRGEFPTPVKIGPRAVGWRESDIKRWLANLEPAQGSPLAKSEGQPQ